MSSAAAGCTQCFPFVHGRSHNHKACSSLNPNGNVMAFNVMAMQLVRGGANDDDKVTVLKWKQAEGRVYHRRPAT